MSPGGRGLVGSNVPGNGGRNPLKTPGGGNPSANGYPRAPKAFVAGGVILAASGVVLGLSSFFLSPPDVDAGVDRAELGLKGSFLPFSVPFSRGDLLPFVAGASLESSTTRSVSLLSPSLSSFFNFFDSGDLGRSAGDVDFL